MKESPILVSTPQDDDVDIFTGEVIGAVGISGDTSDKDEFCAIKAISEIAGFKSDPCEPSATWKKSSLS